LSIYAKDGKSPLFCKVCHIEPHQIAIQAEST
jgi:hypothetical protein